VASRRAAEDLIRAGRVTVNGTVATLGESADADRDAIAFDGEPIQREPLEYWIVNKPRGVLTTVSDPQGRSTVIDLAQESTARLFPVGRLDLLSEGLVLLTNDGPLAHSLLHPSFGEEREYRVTVRGSIDRSTLRRISKGVELEDGLTAPARAGAARFDRETRTTRFALTLVEGRKRQIRRMMRELGHPVVRLVRVRMGPLELGQLAPGKARPLRARERRALKRALKGSPREEQAGGK
jgi:23S rRNA pseudouridine2605 synthase